MKKTLTLSIIAAALALSASANAATFEMRHPAKGLVVPKQASQPDNSASPSTPSRDVSVGFSVSSLTWDNPSATKTFALRNSSSNVFTGYIGYSQYIYAYTDCPTVGEGTLSLEPGVSCTVTAKLELSQPAGPMVDRLVLIDESGGEVDSIPATSTIPVTTQATFAQGWQGTSHNYNFTANWGENSLGTMYNTGNTPITLTFSCTGVLRCSGGGSSWAEYFQNTTMTYTILPGRFAPIRIRELSARTTGVSATSTVTIQAAGVSETYQVTSAW